MLENFQRSVNVTEWDQLNFQGKIHSAKRLWHLFGKKKKGKGLDFNCFAIEDAWWRKTEKYYFSFDYCVQ